MIPLAPSAMLVQTQKNKTLFVAYLPATSPFPCM